MNPFSLMSPRRKRLVVSTLGAFTVCAVLPGTGLLVRHELVSAAKNAVSEPYYGYDASREAVENARIVRARLPLDQAVAARMPNDFSVQLAACERSVPEDNEGIATRYDNNSEHLPPAAVLSGQKTGHYEQVAHKLLALAPRFDANPSYHAAVLRNLAFEAVRLNNPHDADVFHPKPAVKKTAAAVEPEPVPTPENLRAWHTAAQAGERLEPQNAYFSLMGAAGCFAENRDEDGITALVRASTKPAYDDYAGDTAAGVNRLNEAESGEQTALSHLITQVVIQTHPDHPVLQNLADLAAAKAMGAEQQNRRDEGLRLRQALRRIGMTVRENSRAWSGVRLGEDITETACLRPGGAALVSEKETNYNTRVTANYETYLRNNGYPSEAAAIAFEASERNANRELFRRVQDNPAFYLSLPRLMKTAGLPLVNLLLLTNALFLLFAGAAAALLARTRPIADGLPLPPAVQWGIASAVLLPVGVTLTLSFGLETAALFTAATIAAGGAAYWSRARRQKEPAASQPVRAALLWAGGLAGTWALAAVITFAANPLGQAVWGPLAELGMRSAPTDSAPVVAPVFVTLILSLLFAACSVQMKIPASVGILRGIRGLAVPVACVLVLLTVPLTFWAAYENATLNRDLDKAVLHESRYIAEISHKPWPLHVRPMEKMESSRP